MYDLKNKDEFIEISRELLDFIDRSPSCFHVTDNLKKELKGYTELKEGDDFNLEAGRGYYVCRNSSSIIAFRIPKKSGKGAFNGFKITAAHSDSPSFKVKPGEGIKVDDKYVKLNTEKYGGMILSPWLDRPLSVAGRIFIDSKGKIEEKLVNIDRDLLIIPNVAIHMNRKVNEGYTYDPQVDMLPLFKAVTPFDKELSKDGLIKLVSDAAGADANSVIGSDLFVYPRVKGTFLGADDEMIASRALDDLQCAYAIMKGFVNGAQKTPAGYIPVCCVFDNEEVGSLTRQGADSDFLYDVLYRIAAAIGGSGDPGIRLMKLLSGSMMISADNAHAVHPNHSEYADPSNRPYLNKGVVVKTNAAQKYTTDGFSYANLASIAKKAGVPLQDYTNRSDIAGGSTLGNLSARHISIPTVDIGLAQLAMHSCYETAGSYDTGYLIRLIREFYK